MPPTEDAASDKSRETLDVRELNFTLEVDWSAAGQAPVLPLNQYLVQTGSADGSGKPEGIYLALGHTGPPIIYGSPRTQFEAIKALAGRVPVTSYGRYFMTRAQLQAFIDVLTKAAHKYDADVEETEK